MGKAVVALITGLIFICGCVSETNNTTTTTIATTTTTTLITELSELQVTACDAADEGNSCAELERFGIVTEEECCSALGKCCP